MKRLRWQILIVVISLAAIGIILLSQQPNVQPVVTDATPQPVAGGEYIEALIGTPSRFNPLLDFYNPVDRDVDRLIFSSLIRFDGRGVPIADLAESWGVSQDGTVYNFSLRNNAVWHDGEPVTSADILFTVELLRSTDLPIPADLQMLWEEVEVEALDEYLLQFKLAEPFAPFLDYLTFGILPEHILGSLTPIEFIDAQYNLQPVGSGSYRFDELILENGEIKGISLFAFEGYYNQRAFIDQVIFRYYPNGEKAFEAYQQGEVLGISWVSPEILERVLGEPQLNTYTGRLSQLTLLLLNLDNPEVPFFQELEVREALLGSLNRQRMIDRILFGQAILANGPIFPGTWAYFEIDGLNYDLDAAINLLRTAGYSIPAEGGRVRAKDDVFLSFTLVYPDDKNYEQIAQFIQSSWNQIGFDVNIEAVPYDALLNDYLDPRTYHAALVNLDLARSPDPDPYPFWHQTQITGGQNYAKWDDRPASEYLEQARVTLDLEERARLYRNFQVRFAREIPAIPLFYPVYTYAVNSEIQGLSMGPLFDQSDRLANLPEWYLESQVGEATGVSE